eukprot:jgi/Mesen1/8761/ME000524S08058
MAGRPGIPGDYISRRSPLLSRRGMTASSQPLASEAGLRILQKGGTAADAAVAMAAALNVTEPCSTGLGGDAFVLYYNAKSRTVQSIQGNGKSPAGLTMGVVKERGHDKSFMLPPFDALTVAVPGAAACWVDTVERFGHLSLVEILEPAIQLAESGWPVGPLTAWQWAKGVRQLEEGGPHGADLLLEGKRAPRAGEVMCNPHLAQTFRRIAEHGKKGFYEGPVAEAIVEIVRSKGGVLSLDDLAAHKSHFEAPISSTYRGVRVWEVPPPTQGIAALLALNIVEAGGEIGALTFGSVEHTHLMIEAMRLAFADTLTHVADPQHLDAFPAALLLSKEYAAKRAAAVDRAFCIPAETGLVRGGGSDTVYFCAVDEAGNACSMINSNYMGFGTGIVPQGCGFSLQNRAHNFSLDPAHPNCLAPGKRPYHTIIPGLATWAPRMQDSDFKGRRPEEDSSEEDNAVHRETSQRAGEAGEGERTGENRGSAGEEVTSGGEETSGGKEGKGECKSETDAGEGATQDGEENGKGERQQPESSSRPSEGSEAGASGLAGAGGELDREEGTNKDSPGRKGDERPGGGAVGGGGGGEKGERGGGDAGDLFCAFGVMGGFMQPQGHLQVISNMVDFQLDPQAALDAPRFCLSGLPCFERGHGAHPVESSRLYLEDGVGRSAVAHALTKMGHGVELVSGEDREVFGRGQIIVRDRETGVLWAGSEGRADGCAMGW